MTVLPRQHLSEEVLNSKYRLQDKQGNFVEDAPEGIFRRVAKALASVEDEDRRRAWEIKFYNAMLKGAYPGGRIISNAGAEKYKPATSLINCTVSGYVDDSMESILNEVKDAGITLKAGCGIGYCFSTLRPKGAFVNGVGAETSGPLSFMDIYDKMCATIASAGGRRGAQMATFDIRHPDVIDFIRAKREDGRLRKFNMSVLVTDCFMDALKNDEMWEFYFPVSQRELSFLEESALVWDYWPGYIVSNKPEFQYNTEGEVRCKVYSAIKCKDLWDIITDSTYNYSEPGVIFIDKMNYWNNLWFCEDFTATNPCGEVVLPNHGSCLLGSINLVNFVSNPFNSGNADTPYSEFNFLDFFETAKIFTRMLDNVVELSGLPLKEQRDELTRKRRHGMGVLGLGSALAMMGIRYGSPAAIEFTERVMKYLVKAGWEVAMQLAQEKGAAPIFGETFKITPKITETYGTVNDDLEVSGAELFGVSPYISFLYEEGIISSDQLDFFESEGPRFSHHTAIAPTGTLALTLGNNVSGGVEPSFAHSYFRNLTVSGKKTRQQEEVMSYEYALYKHLVGDCSVGDLPDYFVSADDVTPKEHLNMQAAAQKYVDQSISKTINVPEHTPIEEFRDLYQYGYDRGVKGTTTFRFNPEVFAGVLVKEEDLKNTTYEFTLKDGTTVEVTGDQKIEYEGETHNAAMLFDAIKEGQYHSGY